MTTKEEAIRQMKMIRLQQHRLRQKMFHFEAAGDMKLRGLLGAAVLSNLCDPAVQAFATRVLSRLKGEPARKLSAALNAIENLSMAEEHPFETGVGSDTANGS